MTFRSSQGLVEYGCSMTWLIVLLVLVIAVGPVMYLVPTAADKRLGGLREAARRLGLTVQLTSVPKLDPASHERVSAGGKSREPRLHCVAYRLALGDSLSAVRPLQLLRLPPQPTVPVEEVMPGWALAPASDRDFWQQFNRAQQGEQLLERLTTYWPQDVLSLSIDEREIACLWQEKAAVESDAVMQISTALKALRAFLVERF